MKKDDEKELSTVGPRGRARRQAILEAAEHLFIEKGFEKTTLTDIINRSGGSRATLYEHFGDKEGLFRAMMEENCTRTLDGISAAHADELASPEEALTKFALLFVHSLHDERAMSIVRVLVSEGGRISDIAESFIRIGPETAVARVAEYLKRLGEAGALRIEDADAAARAFIGMVTGDLLINRLILPKRRIADEELDRYVRQAVRLFLTGTAASRP